MNLSDKVSFSSAWTHMAVDARQAERASRPLDFARDFRKLALPADLISVLTEAPSLSVPKGREDLLNWALGRESGRTDWSYENRDDIGTYNVAFEVNGRG